MQRSLVQQRERWVGILSCLCISERLPFPRNHRLTDNQTLQEMQSEYSLEEFSESDLLVNITRHFLVPKHQIMKPDEKAALIKK